MLEGLQEITYLVPDLDGYATWLQQVVGAREVRRFPGLIQCRIGTTLVTLHHADEKGPTGPGGQVAYWAVVDIQAAIAHFEQWGGRRYRGPIAGVDGPSVAQVQDPWGNVWGLWQA
ncbi:MAG: bleomycin resistance protein [Sulfobacillus acidophilus]|uniref:Bleomycin resistance protein n=1 Tax=Sulfobacillus acidophilus TaxID=53633 RepID=A0A2T2WDD0_9FIRM|nr:MAG: bleomycin resistance protein [Sulfobacillus acidophilus]